MTFIKRLIVFVISILILTVSITLSGLNTQEVSLDLYIFTFQSSFGFLIISSLIIGLLLGLLLFLLLYYLPMKSTIRKLQRKNSKLVGQNLISND